MTCSCTGSEVYPGSVTITPVNDAPEARPRPDQAAVARLPMVPSDLGLNTGLRAAELASLFYTDVDSEDLGLALLYADTPGWGTWEVQRSGLNEISVLYQGG